MADDSKFWEICIHVGNGAEVYVLEGLRFATYEEAEAWIEKRRYAFGEENPLRLFTRVHNIAPIPSIAQVAEELDFPYEVRMGARYEASKLAYVCRDCGEEKNNDYHDETLGIDAAACPETTVGELMKFHKYRPILRRDLILPTDIPALCEHKPKPMRNAQRRAVQLEKTRYIKGSGK